MRIYYAIEGSRQYQFMNMSDRNLWIKEKPDSRRTLTNSELVQHAQKDRHKYRGDK
jgi:hypothetical protein